MYVMGMVSRSEPVEVDGKEYHNLSIEGFDVIPGDGLNGSLPKRDQMISGTVRVHWRKGKRPLHFLTDWKPVSAG